MSIRKNLAGINVVDTSNGIKCTDHNMLKDLPSAFLFLSFKLTGGITGRQWLHYAGLLEMASSAVPKH